MDPASEWWTVEGWKPAGLQRGATTPALGVRGSKTPRTSPNGIQPAPYVVGRRGADAPRPRRPAAAVAVRGLATPGLLLTHSRSTSSPLQYLRGFGRAVWHRRRPARLDK